VDVVNHCLNFQRENCKGAILNLVNELNSFYGVHMAYTAFLNKVCDVYKPRLETENRCNTT